MSGRPQQKAGGLKKFRSCLRKRPSTAGVKASGEVPSMCKAPSAAVRRSQALRATRKPASRNARESEGELLPPTAARGVSSSSAHAPALPPPMQIFFFSFNGFPPSARRADAMTPAAPP